MSYKISVIIPVYNAEKTLKLAINSVINQTFGFENIELICVDDCSKDNSKLIIEEFSNKYVNIKGIFLDKNSGGPSKPRNIGIDAVTSDYIMFCDSDDEFVNDYCETLYSAINSGDYDICICENYSRFLDGIYAPSSTDSKEKKLVTNPHILRHTMWGNIFKTSLIVDNNIKCPNTLCEDGVFGIKAFTMAKTIVYLPNYHGYIYTVESKDNASVTHDVNKEDISSYIDGCYLINEYLNENNIEKTRLINSIAMIFFMFFKLKASKDDKIFLLDKLNDFEKSIGQPVVLKVKVFNILNNLVVNRNYGFFIIICSIARIFYKNRFIKNFLFRKYSNFKKISH